MCSRIKDVCAGTKQEVDSEWDLIIFDENNSPPITKSMILNCLEEKYLIREGGKVYKIPVNQSGELVVVKKILTPIDIEAKLAKIPEVEILKKTKQNSNIVTLIGYMSKKDNKWTILMYEYLEQQSLDRLLHTPPLLLDWPKRLKIAVGVAQALCYMHHECSPPIVHRDLKSSNILLDAEFNAKIAKFTSAKFLARDSDTELTRTLTGPFGYSSEYLRTKTNKYEKADVNEFGVILLELVTGKDASYIKKHSKVAEWAKQPIAHALDKEVYESSYLSEMTNVFKLGVLCTTKDATESPSMKEAVCELLLLCSPTVRDGTRRMGMGESSQPPSKKNKNKKKLENVSKW